MPSVRHAMLGIIGLALAGCQTLDPLPSERVASAALHFSDGAPAGTARLLGRGTQLNVTVALAGFSPGEHGVHLHAIGSCEAPDFASAGGHLDPAGRAHGSQNPAGAHLGDLPNATIGANGSGTVSATLREGRAQALAAIFDSDGTAVVIHAGPDDYRTDPAGASGERIACGVLRRT